MSHIEEQAKHAAANGTGESYVSPNIARAEAGLGEAPVGKNAFDGPKFLKAQGAYIAEMQRFHKVNYGGDPAAQIAELMTHILAQDEFISAQSDVLRDVGVI